MDLNKQKEGQEDEDADIKMKDYESVNEQMTSDTTEIESKKVKYFEYILFNLQDMRRGKLKEDNVENE